MFNEGKQTETLSKKQANKHLKFAVVIPFRDNPYQDRSGHLAYFIPFMLQYLSKLTDRDFVFIVVEQSQDSRKFNRGKLLNIGFKEALKMGCDYYIFHDVDLIPDEGLLAFYKAYPKKPIHLAANWDKYSHLDSFFGGVCSFNTSDFIKVNGFPNNFWGWGAEDDELLLRIQENNLNILKPTVGKYSELNHIHAKEVESLVNPERDVLLAERYSWVGKNGLSDLEFIHIEKKQSISNDKVFFFEVGL